MVSIESVDVEWLVLLINGYGPQAQQAAGADAVPAAAVDEDQPAVAARVTGADKRRLAGDLWSVFAAPEPDQRAAAFGELLAVSELSPHVGAAAELTWSTPRDDPAHVLVASCTLSLLDAITAHGWARLGTCAGCDCLDVYVDRAARGRPRRYCSPTCLNRAKVRAFRARSTTTSANRRPR